MWDNVNAQRKTGEYRRRSITTQVARVTQETYLIDTWLVKEFLDSNEQVQQENPLHNSVLLRCYASPPTPLELI